MDSDAARPVSDAERERVTGVLREQMASGRLALSDYQVRLRRVRAAATAAELESVLRDLPGRREDDGDERPHVPADTTAEAAPESAAAGPKRAGCGGAAAVLVAMSVVGCAVAGRMRGAR